VKKGGNEMNRKMVILLVAMVATILPAVAVADVMISGSASITVNSTSDLFQVGPGPNYGPAQNMGLFNWTSIPVSESEDLGALDVNFTSNQTVNEINVLEISQFKIDTSSANNYFNITIDQISSLAPGSTFDVFASESPLVFSGPDYQTGTDVQSGSLVGSGTITMSFHDVTSGTVIYIGFVVGPLFPTPSAKSPTFPVSTSMTFSLTALGA